MPATTLAALHDAIATAVIGITPDHTPEGGYEWARVLSPDDAAESLRTFCVEIDEDSFEGEGGIFTSDAISYWGDLRIYTGYGGLTDPEVAEYRSADRRQLYQTLTTSAITGLEVLLPQRFEQDPDSERGRRFGAHVFRIRYLLSNTTS